MSQAVAAIRVWGVLHDQPVFLSHSAQLGSARVSLRVWAWFDEFDGGTWDMGPGSDRDPTYRFETFSHEKIRRFVLDFDLNTRPCTTSISSPVPIA